MGCLFVLVELRQDNLRCITLHLHLLVILQSLGMAANTGLTIRCDADEEEWDRTMSVLARYSEEEAERMNQSMQEYRPELAERDVKRRIRRRSKRK